MLLICSFLIFIFISIFSSPFPQPNPVVFSGRTKIRKNNEECLILHVFNYTERLILHISRYPERLILHISGYPERLILQVSAFSPHLFPAQKSFFGKKYKSIII